MSGETSFTIRINSRQGKILSMVEDEYGQRRTEIVRRLIDTHLEPIAVRLGLEAESKTMERSSMDIPPSVRRLTKSQFSALVDMFLKGWRTDDLASFYNVSKGDLDLILIDRTRAEVCELRARLRRIVGREQRKWQHRDGEI
ncbi:MAG: hypothetical protein AMS21_01060 [Gemmatimonas sp. SG8_38_2]|nr:MAG: hypothetical protein AMS21_01060 [Gemmatimonas sp. SG8_38_2]